MIVKKQGMKAKKMMKSKTMKKKNKKKNNKKKEGETILEIWSVQEEVATTIYNPNLDSHRQSHLDITRRGCRTDGRNTIRSPWQRGSRIWNA